VGSMNAKSMKYNPQCATGFWCDACGCREFDVFYEEEDDLQINCVNCGMIYDVLADGRYAVAPQTPACPECGWHNATMDTGLIECFKCGHTFRANRLLGADEFSGRLVPKKNVPPRESWPVNSWSRRAAVDDCLVCKMCGYKQYDEGTIQAFRRKYPGMDVFDMPYYCGACMDCYDIDSDGNPWSNDGGNHVSSFNRRPVRRSAGKSAARRIRR